MIVLLGIPETSQAFLGIHLMASINGLFYKVSPLSIEPNIPTRTEFPDKDAFSINKLLTSFDKLTQTI